MIAPARRPLVLIIRDGWGHNPDPRWNHANAVHLARTPVDDRLRAAHPHVLIRTSGEHVGLPDGVMGNSEVGHQNIGAGRVVDQEQMRITRSIRDGSFFENAVLRAAVDHARAGGGTLHLMGLCSDAGVHSALEHLEALLELAKRRGCAGDQVLLHAVSDGRDAPPTSGVEYVRRIEAKMRALGVGRVATVIGRYFAMDRDHRWDRVEKAYRLFTRGDGVRAATAEQAFTQYYERPASPNTRGDEFIQPTVVGDPRSIRPGDAVIFFNFRGDRPREIVKAFVFDEFPYSPPLPPGEGRGEGKPPVVSTGNAAPSAAGTVEHGFTRGPRIADLRFCTMCDYEAGLPVDVAFPRPPRMRNILGAYVASLGLRQFRCAETEKYPHVTFFFNDYRDEPFDGEDRRLIPSPRDVATYDQKPEMSAFGVTEEVLARIAADRYDVMIVNYANPDMVGHSGVLHAAIQAVETVDACVGRVVDAVLARGGAAIVTADHGNCEQMIDPGTGGPHTAHTTNDVDLIVADDRLKAPRLREGGCLADIAPTLLALGGLKPPPEMSGLSLLLP